MPVELYKIKTPLMSYTDINSAEALLEYRLQLPLQNNHRSRNLLLVITDR
jgi:hypothetical protein